MQLVAPFDHVTERVADRRPCPGREPGRGDRGDRRAGRIASTGSAACPPTSPPLTVTPHPETGTPTPGLVPAREQHHRRRARTSLRHDPRHQRHAGLVPAATSAPPLNVTPARPRQASATWRPRRHRLRHRPDAHVRRVLARRPAACRRSTRSAIPTDLHELLRAAQRQPPAALLPAEARRRPHRATATPTPGHRTRPSPTA